MTSILQVGRVQSGGETIYYEWISQGPADDRPVVVLTHGAGGNHAVWFQQVPALAMSYRVLTWDSRGFGNSTNALDALSPAAAVADLSALLAEVGVGEAEAVHLVGQSMGGWWVVAFALAQPRRLRSLTLSDTPGGVMSEAMEQHFGQFLRRGGMAEAVELGRHPGIGEGIAATDPALAFLYQELGSFHNPPTGAIGRVLGTARHDLATVRGLGVPMLVLAGAEDEIFPAALLADLARDLGASYVEIPLAGHSPYFEQAGRYNEAVLNFLSNADRR